MQSCDEYLSNQTTVRMGKLYVPSQLVADVLHPRFIACNLLANVCSIKQGKVVIVLNGRFAGRKAVVLRVYESGTKDRKFGHALVAGIERAPRKITKSQTDASKAHRMRIKPFVKFVNFQHIMPTRYNLDISEELTKLVSDEALIVPEQKKQLKSSFKAKLEERYKNLNSVKNEKFATGVQYFFRLVVT